MSEEQRELIEKIGVFHEQRGMQPLMGRIVGLFLVLDNAEATFDEIVEHLNVSKSAVSNALNFMQAQNTVEYRTKPGERKRYFSLNICDWEKDIERKLSDVAKVNSFMEEVIRLRGDKKSEFTDHLCELSRFLQFLKSEIPLEHV